MANPINPDYPFFTLNGNIKERNLFPHELLQNSPVYEVIRIVEGKPLFFQDHLLRLSNSCLKMGIACDIDNTSRWLTQFINTQNISQCNLRLSIYANEKSSNFLAYFIPSKYPTAQQYSKGVDVELLSMVRRNPEVKVVNQSLREKADEIISQKGVYEVLLVNENDEITEGSRSNFFAVKNNAIYTAPLTQVLEGITRKKVVQLAIENGIECIEQPIRVETLKTFDGAFLTGTSPMVLPICRIGKIEFNSVSPVIRKVKDFYTQLVNNNLLAIPS